MLISSVSFEMGIYVMRGVHVWCFFVCLDMGEKSPSAVDFFDFTDSVSDDDSGIHTMDNQFHSKDGKTNPSVTAVSESFFNPNWIGLP